MVETPVPHAEVRVDLTAIRDNVATLVSRAPGAAVLAVVKADGYGHGLVPSARAALAGGATWLGTAVLSEALLLRMAGIRARILCWLAAPGERWDTAIDADIDVTASAAWTVDEISTAAARVGRSARLHLKADTGLGRNGATLQDWPGLVDSALKAQADGRVDLVGLWSHFALADAPGHPTITRQLDAFREAVALAEGRGARPEVRHLANSAATLTLPHAHFDLVRPGIAVYGLSPIPQESTPAQLGLRPAMSVRARLAHVKRVPAGHGVSYGHEYVTTHDTTLGLIPLGYGDGIPRHAGNRAPILAAGAVRPIAGRVCMDQIVVDLGDDAAAPGDEVVLFGDGSSGEPLAEEWAVASDTISYEIVTRMAPRLPRRYVGADEVGP
jgi:alanine racemase